jgi:hypothetical protein
MRCLLLELLCKDIKVNDWMYEWPKEWYRRSIFRLWIDYEWFLKFFFLLHVWNEGNISNYLFLHSIPIKVYNEHNTNTGLKQLVGRWSADPKNESATCRTGFIVYLKQSDIGSPSRFVNRFHCECCELQGICRVLGLEFCCEVSESNRSLIFFHSNFNAVCRTILLVLTSLGTWMSVLASDILLIFLLHFIPYDDNSMLSCLFSQILCKWSLHFCLYVIILSTT